MEISLIRNFH